MRDGHFLKPDLPGDRGGLALVPRKLPAMHEDDGDSLHPRLARPPKLLTQARPVQWSQGRPNGIDPFSSLDD